MADDSGIRHLGGNRYAVRVVRVERRTHRRRNLKRLVTGTKAQAREVRDALRAELKSSVQERPRASLRDYAEHWLARRVTNGLAATSAERYRYALAHILPVLGELLLDVITRVDVEGYLARRVDEVGEEGGASVYAELRLLRTIARDAVAEGFCDRLWTDRVRPPRCRMYSHDRPNRFTAAQMRYVLSRLPRRWVPLTLLLITTGIRWGEATALHWEDLDLDRGVAKIRRNNRRGVIATTTKTDTSRRDVPILPSVLRSFGLQRSAGLIFGTTGTSGEPRPFRGNPLLRVLTRVCLLAGIPRVTVHGLRRTWINLGRGEAELVVVKAISGQATDSMVEHYSHVDDHEKRCLVGTVASKLGIDPELGAAGPVPEFTAGGTLQPPLRRARRAPRPAAPRPAAPAAPAAPESGLEAPKHRVPDVSPPSPEEEPK